MTSDQSHAIDESLAQFGLVYNAQSEVFESAEGPLDGEDVLFALPDLSLSDLAAYEAGKQRRGMSEGAAQQKQKPAGQPSDCRAGWVV